MMSTPSLPKIDYEGNIMLMTMKSKFTTPVLTAGQLYANTYPPSKLLE